MITDGTVSREEASVLFPFLAPKYRGRRAAIKALTHLAPDFVFWIYPNGTLHDARDAHARNVPKGYEHILKDEPDYGGFLRGRVVTDNGNQLIVVYCRESALASGGAQQSQFVKGVESMPVPVSLKALVISDNADIFGTVGDIVTRVGNN